MRFNPKSRSIQLSLEYEFGLYFVDAWWLHLDKLQDGHQVAPNKVVLSISCKKWFGVCMLFYQGHIDEVSEPLVSAFSSCASVFKYVNVIG